MTIYRLLALAALSLLVPPGGARSQAVLEEPGGAEARTAAAPGTVSGPLRLEVSVGERRIRVYEGDAQVKSYPVAIGQDDHPTPTGNFRIRRVIWNPRWVPPRAPWARGKTAKEPGDPDNPMGRVKMFFREPDYYIHGTDEEESLGEAVSHGCIRMANDDVVELARLVMEHGGEPRESSWFRRVLESVRRTREVRLSQPVPVVIRR